MDAIKKSISDYFTVNYEIRCDSETEDNEELEDELFAHVYKRSTPDAVSREFKKYLSYPLPKSEFWKSQEKELPCMSKIASDILAIQTTSVPVERDNLAGADLVTPSRCSLNADTIQTSMCLKQWFSNQFVIHFDITCLIFLTMN